MTRSGSRSPLGEAFTWASRIMAAAAAMSLPAILGHWADSRLQTNLFAPLGLVVGFVAGLAWLVRMASPPQQR